MASWCSNQHINKYTHSNNNHYHHEFPLVVKRGRDENEEAIKTNGLYGIAKCRLCFGLLLFYRQVWTQNLLRSGWKTYIELYSDIQFWLFDYLMSTCHFWIAMNTKKTPAIIEMQIIWIDKKKEHLQNEYRNVLRKL